MGRFYNVAIDGPSGAGKSTIAKMIAEKMGYLYLDTGAMYRAVAYCSVSKGLIGREDFQEAITELVQTLNMEMVTDTSGKVSLLVNGEDVSGHIRTPEISKAAAIVAAIPGVRLRLVEIQRRIASSNNTVLDGRDIGSYVLKDANVKIFLTASPKERAQRRYKELEEKSPGSVTYEEVYHDIIERDEKDRNREFSPLVKADDAIELDSTGMDINEVVEHIEKMIRQAEEQ